MNKKSIFLIFVASVLFMISLSYGIVPNITLVYLYGIQVDSVNLSNIFRAVMGLYMAFVIFWIIGAFYNVFTIPALWSLTFFMGGLASGRFLSFIIDGVPHPLFILWMLLEIVGCVLGYIITKDSKIIFDN